MKLSRLIEKSARRFSKGGDSTFPGPASDTPDSADDMTPKVLKAVTFDRRFIEPYASVSACLSFIRSMVVTEAASL